MMRGGGRGSFRGGKRKISQIAMEERFEIEAYVPPSILPSEDPNYEAPDTWTKEMKKFYLDPIPENRTNTVSDIMSKMPPNGNWEVSPVDFHRSIGSRDRYYGVRCHNCNQWGHIQSDCPDKKRVEVCVNCGIQGHSDTRCKELMCLGCGHHSNIMCSSCFSCRKERNIFCKICSLKGHSEKRCSDHWRKYLFTTKEGEVQIPSGGNVKMKRRNLLWCPNCAQRGHLYEDCSYMMSENPTALSSFISVFDSKSSTITQNSQNESSGSKIRKLNTQNVETKSRSSSPEIIIEYLSMKNQQDDILELKFNKQSSTSKSSSPELIIETSSTLNSKNDISESKFSKYNVLSSKSKSKSNSPELIIETLNVSRKKPNSKSNSPELIIETPSTINSENDISEPKLNIQNVSRKKSNSKSSSPELIIETPSTINSQNEISEPKLNIQNVPKTKSPEILVEEIKLALKNNENYSVCLCIASELSNKKNSLILQLQQAFKLVHNASGNIANDYCKIIENKHLLSHDINVLNNQYSWLLKIVQRVTMFLVGKFGLNNGAAHLSELQHLFTRVKKLKSPNVFEEMLQHVRAQYNPIFSGDYKFNAIKNMVDEYSYKCRKSGNVAKIRKMLKKRTKASEKRNLNTAS